MKEVWTSFKDGIYSLQFWLIIEHIGMYIWNCAVVVTPIWTKHSVCSKLTFFQMVLQMLNLLFCPSPAKFNQSQIGTLKWATICFCTSKGCKVIGLQTLSSSVSYRNAVIMKSNLWLPVTVQSLWIQEHIKAHSNVLICL